MGTFLVGFSTEAEQERNTDLCQGCSWFLHGWLRRQKESPVTIEVLYQLSIYNLASITLKFPVAPSFFACLLNPWPPANMSDNFLIRYSICCLLTASTSIWAEPQEQEKDICCPVCPRWLSHCKWTHLACSLRSAAMNREQVRRFTLAFFPQTSCFPYGRELTAEMFGHIWNMHLFQRATWVVTILKS